MPSDFKQSPSEIAPNGADLTMGDSAFTAQSPEVAQPAPEMMETPAPAFDAVPEQGAENAAPGSDLAYLADAQSIAAETGTAAEAVEPLSVNIENHTVLPNFPEEPAPLEYATEATPDEAAAPLNVAPLSEAATASPEPVKLEVMPEVEPTVAAEDTVPEPKLSPFESLQGNNEPEAVVTPAPELKQVEPLRVDEVVEAEAAPEKDIDQKMANAKQTIETFKQQSKEIIADIDEEKKAINKTMLELLTEHRRDLEENAEARKQLIADFAEKKGNITASLKELDANRADIIQNLGIVEDGKVPLSSQTIKHNRAA